MFESIIGNSDCLKCIVDGEDFAFTSCVAHLLQNVEFEARISDLLVDTVRSHHEVYRCSSKTLYMLAIFWTRELQQLTHSGIPVNIILPVFHKAIELCIRYLDSQYTIDPETLLGQSYQGDDIKYGSGNDKLGHHKEISKEQPPQLQQSSSIKDHVECLQDDNDISWFFDDGNVPEKPDYQKEVVDVLGKAEEMFLEINGQRPLVSSKHNHGPVIPVTSSKSENTNYSSITNRGDDDNDDEDFDFSFEEFDKVVPQDMAQKLDPLEEALAINRTSDSPQMTSKKKKVPTDIAVLLEEKISHLNCGKTKPKVLNRSRHHVTIECLVEELQTSCDGHTEDIEANKANSDSHRAMEDDQKQTFLPIERTDQKKLSHIQTMNRSRHFSSIDSIVEEMHTYKVSSSIGKTTGLLPTPRITEDLIRMLSHGAEEVIPLVLEAFEKQQSDGMQKCFQIHGVLHAYPQEGPSWENSAVVPGIIVASSPEQLMTLAFFKHHYGHKCLLVRGDIKHQYKHKGQQVKQRSVTLKTEVSQGSKSDVWLAAVKSVVSELGVTCLLTSGIVDSCVLELCDQFNITVFQQLRFSILQAVGESCQVDIAEYITDATIDNVATNIQITPFDAQWADYYKKRTSLAVLELPGHTHQTVIICHPSIKVAMHREEQFWHLAHRVASCLRENKMIRGAGKSESVCADFLHRQSQDLLKDCNARNEPEIYTVIAAGFQRFTHLVEQNAGTHFSENDDALPQVCDDFVSKVESWRSACHVASQMLLGDMEITTGVDKTDKIKLI